MNATFKPRTTTTMLTPLVRSTKGFTMPEKNSFMHLRQITKGRVNEIKGQLVSNHRLESKDALDERLSALRQAGVHLRRAFKRP